MKSLSDEEWLVEWERSGRSPSVMARQTGYGESGIYARRNKLTNAGLDIGSFKRPTWTYPAAVDIDVTCGSVLIGGDSHFWPDQNPVMWQAFVKVAHTLKPQVIILNGDVFDGTRISRHPRLRGQNPPRIVDELGACRIRLDELPDAPDKYWSIGNHCQRVDNYLANMAPEMEDFHGGLSDRFNEFTFAYSFVINGNTEVRHMFAGGVHAAYNNAVKTGINIVTNHTHGNEVRSIIDRRGIRYAIETGMLNDPHAAQFEFDQGAVRRCAPGFAYLTYDDEGNMLPPERAELHRGRPYFRGYDVLASKPRISVRADTQINGIPL